MGPSARPLADPWNGRRERLMDKADGGSVAWRYSTVTHHRNTQWNRSASTSTGLALQRVSQSGHRLVLNLGDQHNQPLILTDVDGASSLRYWTAGLRERLEARCPEKDHAARHEQYC